MAFPLLPLLALLTLAHAAAAPPPAPAPARKTVAVLNFDNNSGSAEYDPLGKGLAAMMISDLAGVEAIQLVERERLQELTAEMERQQTKYFDPATATQVGRFAGAEYVVAGAVFALEPRIRIDTRVIRVQTGEIVKAAEVLGRKDQLFELQQKLADRLIDDLAVALSPEERERLRQQQERNRIAEFEVLLAYSQALALFDGGDYVGAAARMRPVVAGAPQSALVRASYELMKRRAAEAGKNRLRDGLNRLLDRRP